MIKYKTAGEMSKKDLEIDMRLSAQSKICFLCHTPIGTMYNIEADDLGRICVCGNCLKKVKMIEDGFLRWLKH